MTHSIATQRFAAYLFDLDGTLVDTVPDIDRALNHALTQNGFATVPQGLTRHWIGHGARALIQQALAHHRVATAAPVEEMLETFLDYYGRHLADFSQPYPGTREALGVLRDRRASLAVVTNKMTALSEPLLRQLGLHDFFDVVVCGDTAASPKPDPAPIFHACTTLRVDPTDSLFVGDSVTDVDAARNAGVAVVCMRDGYNHGTPANQLGADGVIDSLLELV